MSKLYEIGENLYVSSWPKPNDVPGILDAGVTAVVCMSKKRSPEELIQGVRSWSYIPVPDGKSVPTDGLRSAVSEILTLLNTGHVVLVHCLQGRNRSMLAAVLAERTRWGWSGTEALVHARSVRPNCLHNSVFADWLETLPCC